MKVVAGRRRIRRCRRCLMRSSRDHGQRGRKAGSDGRTSAQVLGNLFLSYMRICIPAASRGWSIT